MRSPLLTVCEACNVVECSCWYKKVEVDGSKIKSILVFFNCGIEGRASEILVDIGLVPRYQPRVSFVLPSPLMCVTVLGK